jgi:hypothetical protein
LSLSILTISMESTYFSVILYKNLGRFARYFASF